MIFWQTKRYYQDDNISYNFLSVLNEQLFVYATRPQNYLNHKNYL